MLNPKIRVIECELNAVRALRVARDFGVARAAIDREEELIEELTRLRGVDVLPMAAGFARRDVDPEAEAEAQR